MKIHSIKFKITLLLVVTVTCLVAMLIGFNSIFSEKVYMNRKQKSMINSYENVNEIMQKYTDSQIDKDTMCADMENISTAKGISVLVVDSSWCTIYVSTQGDDSMMERLRMSIFNGDIFKNNGSPDKAPEPKEQEDDSDNPADKDDKKDHRKRLEDIIDMSGTSLVENRTIISSNDNYTLQKVYDERLGDYYLEIWGTLDNGYSIILRTPIQGIKDNVNISQSDWDSFETSWNFKVHPLVKNRVFTISEAYNLWSKECEERFNTLKSNEEELNRIFIDIYGLQDELTPEVEDRDVTVRKADLVRDVKSFISYAVGCMFGRYSLDTEGLAYAGGEWDSDKYKIFIPDSDDIIPVCDEDYFEDDIVSRFVEFVRCVYGEDTLEENLQFISDALGGNGNPRDVLRNYFLKDFFKDHCNTYQVTGSGKRPIYWQFDSGKKNGFKALVYIHRYTPDLIAKMRTGYIHPLQSQYRTQIEMLNNQIDEALSTSEKVRLQKQLKKVTEQAEELGKYEEKIHHWADKMEPMDLDDGVVVNYNKFQELLVPNIVKKIKGV